jgi:hypothetical protein
MGFTLHDVDHGYKARLKALLRLKEPAHIDVGILEAAGAEPHGDDALTVIEVGVFNEFGTATIPERSFIRAWFDESEPQLRADLAVLMQGVGQGKRTRAQALELLGQRCVGQIQERIAAGIEPENRPSTVKRKGSSTPLIHIGTLRSSISYHVEE